MSSLVQRASGVYALDSSIVIELLRNNADVQAKIAQAIALYIPAIVLMELYYGAFNAPLAHVAESVAKTREVEAVLPPLEINAVIARSAGQLKSDLRRRGITMPDNDVLIAATCMFHRVTLAARDVHFDYVRSDGLLVEQW